MNRTPSRYVPRLELEASCADRLAGTRLEGLYVAGSLAGLDAPTVAIVGARAPSDAGRALARRVAHDLGAGGVCVISGLALGIDAAAHEGSLAARAPTIGVLGGGHNRFFPARNRELAARIVAGGGAVVSPYAPDEPARPHQFLARNGIVAALADAVVVVEAASRSGALNTASWAADRAIPVLAFPGDVDRPKVAGCLALIRDGATLVRDAADIFGELGLPAPRCAVREHGTGPTAVPPAATDAVDRRILRRLAREPAALEALLAAGESPAQVLACVGELLAAGTIVEAEDATYRLAPG